LTISKYGRVKSAYNALTTSRLKIVAKDILDFLDCLESGEFDEVLKVEESRIQATSILIYLELIEKEILPTK
jgi:hypothetical protein